MFVEPRLSRWQLTRPCEKWRRLPLNSPKVVNELACDGPALSALFFDVELQWRVRQGAGESRATHTFEIALLLHASWARLFLTFPLRVIVNEEHTFQFSLFLLA